MFSQEKSNPFESKEDSARTPESDEKQSDSATPSLPFILSVGSEPVPGYVLRRRLGRGGYGVVWSAAGPGGVTVAIKFIPLGERAGEVETRALDLMKNIHHPHLTGISGIWNVDDTLIIAMELGDRTLLECLKEAQERGHEGIPADLLHEYMRETAKGIDYLNTLNIVHRDIKPKNLLLMSGGVKVADFGLAKLLERTIASSSSAMTPAYAAPEFFEGKASSQSDQYSLAVSYCQLRGGRLPFNGSAVQLMACHLSGTPDLSMLPQAERPIVARALEKDPELRWPDCLTFVVELSRSATSGRAPVPLRSKQSRRGFLVSALVLLALGLAELARIYLSQRDPLVELREREIEREVSLLKASPPTAIRAHGSNYTEVDQLEPYDNTAFETLSDDRVVDLRAWKEVPSNRMHELYCAVTMTRRSRLKKVKPASTYYGESRTSGLDVFQRCLSPYPTREFGQRGDVYVGNDRMKVRRLTIDVSSILDDAEFDLRTVSSYWNTFQTEQELWFGVVGYEQSFKVSQLLLFPSEKPFKEYTLMVARTVKNTPVPYTGPKLLLSGAARDWIYWEVPNPKQGYVYRLHWKW
jgi:serine/threonine protein kinase